MEFEGNIIDLRQKIFFEILEDLLLQEIKTRFLAINLIQEEELQEI